MAGTLEGREVIAAGLVAALGVTTLATSAVNGRPGYARGLTGRARQKWAHFWGLNCARGGAL